MTANGFVCKAHVCEMIYKFIAYNIAVSAFGASSRIRTDDLRFTKPLLYLLSHRSILFAGLAPPKGSRRSFVLFNGDLRVALAVEDLQHGVQRRDLQILHFHESLEDRRGAAGCQHGARYVGLGLEVVVPGLRVPVDDLGHGVARSGVHRLELVDVEHLLRIEVVFIATVVAGCLVNLHIRDDNKAGGHVLVRDVVVDRELEHLLAGPVQIGGSAPVSHHRGRQILSEGGVVIQHDEAGNRLKGHEQVVERSPVPLGEVHAEARGDFHGTALHGTGNVDHAEDVFIALDEVGKVLPHGFDGRIGFDMAMPVIGVAVGVGVYQILRRVHRGIDLLFALGDGIDELVVAVTVMATERFTVDRAGAAGDLVVLDVRPLVGGHLLFDNADGGTEHGQRLPVFPLGVTEFLGRKTAETAGFLGGAVAALEPLAHQADARSFLLLGSFDDGHGVGLQLALYNGPHVVLQRGSHEGIHVVPAPVKRDQLDVGTHDFRVMLGRVSEHVPEELPFTGTAASVACVEHGFGCEQLVGSDGLPEEGPYAAVEVLIPQAADLTIEIQYGGASAGSSIVAVLGDGCVGDIGSVVDESVSHVVVSFPAIYGDSPV